MRIHTVTIDEGNEEHVTAHGVSVAEIVQVFRNGFTPQRNRKNRSAEWTTTGTTDGGRLIFVAFDMDDDAVRPITAWEV